MSELFEKTIRLFISNAKITLIAQLDLFFKIMFSRLEPIYE